MAEGPQVYVGDEHRCPRCGYDLLGIRPASVDTALTCPECGLTTTWRAMNDVERHARGWHLECADRGTLWAGVRTAFVCLFPGWLWKWVTLELPVRRGRLVRFGAAFAAMLYAVLMGYAGLNAWYQNSWGPLGASPPVVGAGIVRPPATDRAPSAEQIARLDAMLGEAMGANSDYNGIGGLPGYGWGATDGSLRMAAIAWASREGLVLPDGEADRWSAAVGSAVVAVRDAYGAARDRRRTRACVRAVLVPYTPFVIGAPSPHSGALRAAVTLTRIGVLTAAIMPLSFLLLRQSMRVARVRPVHLLRAFAYSQPPVLLFAGVVAALASAASAATGLPWSTQDGLTFLTLPVLAVVAVAAPLWFVRMWQLFVGRYLRLTHAPGVLAAMMLLSAAAACCLCFFAWDRDGMTRLISGM